MTEKKYLFISGFFIVVIIFLSLYKVGDIYNDSRGNVAAVIFNIKTPFTYNFSSPGVLQESGSDLQTTSPYWYLNSGGKLIIEGDFGKTIQGPLSESDKWRRKYFLSNPLDTDNGYYPQNLFRILTRTKWLDYGEEVYFNIKKTNLSNSLNRNESNGILLFSRYQNSNNLYYGGLRVDGNVIVKKKQNGIYTTLSSKKIFSGTYNRDRNPNLLPLDTWIGVRLETENLSTNSVVIRVYTDFGRTGSWTLQSEVVDVNKPILTSGYGGIRTDFMDIFFDSYRITEI